MFLLKTLIFHTLLFALTSSAVTEDGSILKLLLFLNMYNRKKMNIEDIENSLKDVVGLVAGYGYPIERYNVETEDGYILTLHRMPGGKRRSMGKRLVPVFLMQGAISSSADWLLQGPDKSLAYILADAGYDVWLGNARGNYYSRKHTTLDPDESKQFWNFSWNEIGIYDLPAMIDYALKVTAHTRLHYVGHSQGTTSFFVMASCRPEYNGKIKTMHAFAPIAYLSHQRSPVVKLLTDNIELLTLAEEIFNLHEILPRKRLNAVIGHTFCKEGSVFQSMCANLLFLFYGFDREQMNATRLPLYLSHTPAGIATKQLLHYGQEIKSGRFRKFDYGESGNLIKYGTAQPPDYDMRLVTTPVWLYVAENDFLSTIRDVRRLSKMLKNVTEEYRVPYRGFNHVDYLWSDYAKTLVYEKVLNVIRAN